MWALVALVVVAACALAVRWRSVGVPPALAPPVYPGALPLIGHMHLGRGSGVELWSLVKHLSETTLLWGGIINFKLGPRPGYLISDPDDCVTVANSCLEKDFIYDFLKPALGSGLVTADVPIWKTHRKLLTPAFKQVVLDGFMEVFNSQARRLVFALDQESGKKPFDSCTYLGSNTLETFCLTAMGGAVADERLRGEYLHAIETLANTAIVRMQKFWLYSDFTFKFSSLSKNVEKYVKIIHDVSISVLQIKKGNLGNETTNEQSGTKIKPFIDLIIEYSGENGLLTDQEIREELNTIIISGHDTTAATLLFTMVMLGSHPEVQERALKEIEEVIGDRDVEKQDLPKLVYLEAVLKETMRLYPIGPIVVRNVKESLKLKNYTLPAGSSAFLSLYALNRHGMWGADAARFDPARWLDRARLPAHQAAFAAFSLGRRMCIGKSYALMSMKTTMAHVIRNFRLKADASQLQLKLDLMLKPHSGHYVSVERRT